MGSRAVKRVWVYVGVVSVNKVEADKATVLERDGLEGKLVSRANVGGARAVLAVTAVGRFVVELIPAFAFAPRRILQTDARAVERQTAVGLFGRETIAQRADKPSLLLPPQRGVEKVAVAGTVAETRLVVAVLVIQGRAVSRPDSLDKNVARPLVALPLKVGLTRRDLSGRPSRVRLPDVAVGFVRAAVRVGGQTRLTKLRPVCEVAQRGRA